MPATALKLTTEPTKASEGRQRALESALASLDKQFGKEAFHSRHLVTSPQDLW